MVAGCCWKELVKRIKCKKELIAVEVVILGRVRESVVLIIMIRFKGIDRYDGYSHALQSSDSLWVLWPDSSHRTASVEPFAPG
jgi:hypothetical protein